MKNFELINLAESLASWGLVYITVWWVVIFITLPYGVKISEKVEKGHASSAPDNPRIKEKMIVTSIISLVITIAIFTLSYSGLVNFRTLIFGP